MEKNCVSYLHNNEITSNIAADGDQHLNTYHMLSTVLSVSHVLAPSAPPALHKTGAVAPSQPHS